MGLDPHAVFNGGNLAALIAWVALAVTLFVRTGRETAWTIVGLLVPAGLALAYVATVASALLHPSGGGGGASFTTIEGVRAIFATDRGVAAGWLHYLAFDLFVGGWIARDGTQRRVPPLLLLPCLALTFVAGPAGFLLYLFLRLALRR